MLRPFVIAAVALMPGLAAAQDGHSGHSTSTTATDAASTAAYKIAMDRMHQDMMVDYTGNADIDFMRGMIPHHQGAIDMAKIVLEHGKDPQVRKLAQDVVDTQQAEIAMMQAWLAEHDKPE